MLGVLFIVFFVLMFLGVPIAFSMGVSALVSILSFEPQSLIAIPARIFGGLDSFPLMALPLFILAGNFMETGGVSKRLVEFAEVIVGLFKGGLGMAAVIAEVVFSGVSGSASADTSALGAILIQPLVKKGYDKGFVACLLAAGGTIGPIIPPSLLMILYSSATGISVGTLFIAGFIPGLLMAAALMVIVYRYAKKHPELSDSGEKKTFKEGLEVTFKASGALLLPVIVIGGIAFGIFTATEAAAVSVIYAFFMGVFVYKELSIKDSWRLLAQAARDSGGLMVIVGLATFMGWVLTKGQFPVLVSSVLSISDNPQVVMLMIIIFLLIVGCFIESIAALVILTPVLHTLSMEFGFDPIHFAMVVLVALSIGAVTPPVGVLLYISSSMTRIKYTESLRYITPFVVSLLVATFLIAYIPQITTILPDILLK